MLKLLKRGKEAPIRDDVENRQVINDANEILSILRNSVNIASIEFQHVYFLVGRNEGLPYNSVNGRYRSDTLEQRVSDGLKLLVARGCVGWGGHRSNGISFNKNALPLAIN